MVVVRSLPAPSQSACLLIAANAYAYITAHGMFFYVNVLIKLEIPMVHRMFGL